MPLPRGIPLRNRSIRPSLLATAAPQPIQLAFPRRKPDPLAIPGVHIDPQTMDKIMADLNKAEAKRKQDAQEALEAARKWLTRMSESALLKLSYPAILAKIKQDFPTVADLPKPKVLMDNGRERNAYEQQKIIRRPAPAPPRCRPFRPLGHPK